MTLEKAKRGEKNVANMQRLYLSYIDHIKTTGAAKREPPSFYEELHGIIGSKHKVNPEILIDSGAFTPASDYDESNYENETSNDEMLSSVASLSQTPDESVSQTVKNRFSARRSNIKPTSNSQLIDLMNRQLAEEKVQRERHFKTLETLLIEQNNQREKFLIIYFPEIKKGKEMKLNQMNQCSNGRFISVK